MPRVATVTKPQPTLTNPKKTTARKPPHGHGDDGKFIAGNVGGPGNPHVRHCARMLALLRTCIADEEMVATIRTLVEKAVKGDASAAKIILTYKIGKPAPAPNPDQIDRDEWEHYQKDTIDLQEMQQVLSSLPAKVGNDIARTALPIMTEARARELATQIGLARSSRRYRVDPQRNPRNRSARLRIRSAWFHLMATPGKLVPENRATNRGVNRRTTHGQ